MLIKAMENHLDPIATQITANNIQTKHNTFYLGKSKGMAPVRALPFFMPSCPCGAGIKKGGSYASLLPMRTVRATQRGSLGSDAGINRYQEWVQRLPCFPNDRQDPVEVHHPRSPALGTSDTSYMQQFSGLLRTAHKMCCGMCCGK